MHYPRLTGEETRIIRDSLRRTAQFTSVNEGTLLFELWCKFERLEPRRIEPEEAD